MTNSEAAFSAGTLLVDQWLDLSEAAAHVGVARAEVARAVLDGGLQAAIHSHPSRPGEWLVLSSHVEAWASHLPSAA